MQFNRTLLKYGEDVDLSENEKKTHAYTVLREWPSAREQLRLGQLYASEHGREKFCWPTNSIMH